MFGFKRKAGYGGEGGYGWFRVAKLPRVLGHDGLQGITGKSYIYNTYNQHIKHTRLQEQTRLQELGGKWQVCVGYF